MSKIIGYSTDLLVNKPIIGYLRRDGFGRLYIDSCASDSEHMAKPPELGEERRRCRKYIEDLVPASFHNKKIQLQVDIGIVVLEGAEDEHE